MPNPATLFHSLSDPVRLRLLRLLAREELNVQELVAITGLSQPRVSKHVGILRQEGWLVQRRQGTWSWYRLADHDDLPGGPGLLKQALPLADGVAQAAKDDQGLEAVLAERQLRARDFFTGMADRWDAIRAHYAHPDLDLGLMAALAEPGLRVLDVGTGRGTLLPELAAAGARVLALDLSLPMLRRARRTGAEATAGGVAFCCASAEALPLPDGVFDTVLCAMVLHHLARPGRALAELARVLRPGGRLAVTSFCTHDQEWMREELAHQWLGFSGPEMEEFFRGAGLVPMRRIERGPLQTGGLETGRGPAAPSWPDIFLMTGVKGADTRGLVRIIHEGA